MEISKNEVALKKCEDLILNKFRVVDLIYCLNKLNIFTSGNKSYLQKRLMNILYSIEKERNTIKVILERGDIIDYYCKTDLEMVGVVVTSISDIRSNYNSYNCIFHGSNINMKKLYFYENIQTISDWSYIETRNINHHISLNLEIPSKLCRTLFFEMDQQNSPQTFVLLRCAKITEFAGVAASEDSYPVGMKLLINGKDFTFLLPREVYYNNHDRRERISYPTILNEGILHFQKFSTIKDFLKVEIMYGRNGNKNNSYAFGIFSSTEKTIEKVCQEILCQKWKSIKNFEDDLNKFMTTSGEIKLDRIKIPLRSSISLNKIKIPFRGRSCNHITPDDLEDYIQVNKNNEKWLCRICNSPCTPDDIIVDDFYVKVLKKHLSIEEIVLFPGRKYQIIDKKPVQLWVDLTEKKKKYPNVITIDDDDDDEIKILCEKSSSLRTSTHRDSLRSRIRYRSSLRRSERIRNICRCYMVFE